MTGFKTARVVAMEQPFSSKSSDFENWEVPAGTDDFIYGWKPVDPVDFDDLTDERGTAGPADCGGPSDRKKKTDGDLDYLFFELGAMLLDALDDFF